MGIWGSFTARAEDRPEAPALVWHGEDTSYGDLRDRAEAARRRVDALGLAPGEPVGLLAKKSPAAVALVLGCLAAGRRFLLPSPTLGDDLLAGLFAAAGCRHVLAPDGAGAPDGLGGRSAEPDPADGRLAGVSFMLTTSGSTGAPKVVPLRDDAVDRFAGWAGDAFGIGPGVTVLNYAPLNFDLCLLDVWTTLARGGRVALVDPDLATQGGHLLDVLAQDVAVVQAVPMFFRLLLDATRGGEHRVGTVRHVVVTGDSAPAATLAALPGMFPGARFHNVYGCTETNDSFAHELDPAGMAASSGNGAVPIGRPLPGVHAAIVADDGTLLDGPGRGELHVCTPFQSDGYLDRSRDAGRFGPHPAGADERRWFRTGDLVRRLDDGTIVLDGRTDFQVKVRGTAVNTAEVERVLLEHPEIAEAAVVAVADPLAGRRLCCSVRRSAGSRLNSLVLRGHCARLLPPAAVPSAMRIGDEPLPRTSTGKVDRTQVEITHQS
jgi:acyl-coenzyme A synthetase/AMP-(fatty) acid ligase